MEDFNLRVNEALAEAGTLIHEARASIGEWTQALDKLQDMKLVCQVERLLNDWAELGEVDEAKCAKSAERFEALKQGIHSQEDADRVLYALNAFEKEAYDLDDDRMLLEKRLNDFRDYLYERGNDNLANAQAFEFRAAELLTSNPDPTPWITQSGALYDLAEPFTQERVFER